MLWCLPIHKAVCQQTAASSPPMAGSLCVYLWVQSGQRGQVWPSARLSRSKWDRTEQAIFSTPLWLNFLFSQHWLSNCFVSHYKQRPDGAASNKPSKRITESRGWGRNMEARVIKSNARPQTSSWCISKGLVWAGSSAENLFCGSQNHSGIHHVYAYLLLFTQVAHSQVKHCLLQSQRCMWPFIDLVLHLTGYGLYLSSVSWAVSLRFPCGPVHCRRITGQTAWLYFTFSLNVSKGKILASTLLLLHGRMAI